MECSVSLHFCSDCMFCLIALKGFENSFNILLVSCSHFCACDPGLPSYFKPCLKKKKKLNSLIMIFSKHLVKKAILNMFHLHITKVQQKEKKVSYQLSVLWKVWDYLRDATVSHLSSKKHTINVHFRNCYCCLQ